MPKFVDLKIHIFGLFMAFLGLRTVRITVTAVSFTAVNSVRSSTAVTVFHILNPKRVRYGPETAVNGCYGRFFYISSQKFYITRTTSRKRKQQNNRATEQQENDRT